MDDRLREVLSHLVSPEFALKVSLLMLAPQGIALKRQILRNLLRAEPDALTCTEAGRGGPDRNIGSVHHALHALERIGVVRESDKRWSLVPQAKQAVLEFLSDEDGFAHAVVIKPLPKRERYVRVLEVVCGAPKRFFSINNLVDRRCGSESLVRKVTDELSRSGYLLRKLSDPKHAGHQTWLFGLNPEAERYARSLLNSTAEATPREALPIA